MIRLFIKQASPLNAEVKRIEPSRSVRVPCCQLTFSLVLIPENLKNGDTRKFLVVESWEQTFSNGYVILVVVILVVVILAVSMEIVNLLSVAVLSVIVLDFFEI